MYEKAQPFYDKLIEMGYEVNVACLEKITKSLASILGNADAAYVAATDESEMATVQKNFVEAKLEVESEKAAEVVAAVAAKMKGMNKKPRVVFYYLCCEELGCCEDYANA